VNTGGFAFEFVQAFLNVEVVQGFLGAGDGSGVVRGYGAGFFDGAGGVLVEFGGGFGVCSSGLGCSGRGGSGGVFFVGIRPSSAWRFLLIGDRRGRSKMSGGFWFARKSGCFLGGGWWCPAPGVLYQVGVCARPLCCLVGCPLP